MPLPAPSDSLSPLASQPTPRRAPELLAPAGQWECLSAAIENGADAVYFGLDCGFNARARASNFHLDDLDSIMSTLHHRGVLGYVTVNTLAFANELADLERILARIAQVGVDAILVQDFGVARLARQICPQLPLHASTQMTLTSAETIAVAAELGISRVVIPRETSVKEIAKIHSQTDMPLEAFIHGALCVAYSGQCLTSESLGGRSANRGQCAQACRLPYELICDGEDQDLGDVRYLLSPQDLAGYALIPELIEAGICSLKIEGRLKTPEYVANITAHYRNAIDQAMADGVVNLPAKAVDDMQLSFSRGFSQGWLNGCDHKELVPGKDSAKRGILLGSITEVKPHSVILELQRTLARGDGLGFAGGREEGTQQGGRVFGLYLDGNSVDRTTAKDTEIEVVFGRGDIDFDELHVGQLVWKSDDPDLNRRLRRSYGGKDPQRCQPLDMQVTAIAGQPLQVTATTASGNTASDSGTEPLQVARNLPATDEMIREKIGRLGGSSYELRQLSCRIEGSPMVPVSMINKLRRSVVENLQKQSVTPEHREVRTDALKTLRMAPAGEVRTDAAQQAPTTERLTVLCRSLEQISAAAEFGIKHLYADFQDIRLYGEAIRLASEHQAEVMIASLRIQKPGELGLFNVLRRTPPAGMLCRNLAALAFCREQGWPAIVDFSLNVANDLSARWMHSLGAQRITPSYDLNREQLMALIDAVPAEWLEIVVHQHMPMFHMEHCVFCSVLSEGTNKTNCGRPCDTHVVSLRDRTGVEHPLQADIACRNTLYNAVPQSAAEAVSDFKKRGIQHFRVELLEENAADTASILQTYQELLAGHKDGASVWKELKALNRVGVTRGTMESKRDPLAII
ncbi:putative protease YhbU precursor [Roseimaritima multifibrata]|uniref:Putative protease YhbU n=2 Tax=Roseimaritima multifibrata TaxID=1930274 RepID=A0A517MB12_9BACT|nr:putative protease YhbU precursor [Roseimaritima multifibrata]